MNAFYYALVIMYRERKHLSSSHSPSFVLPLVVGRERALELSAAIAKHAALAQTQAE